MDYVTVNRNAVYFLEPLPTIIKQYYGTDTLFKKLWKIPRTNGEYLGMVQSTHLPRVTLIALHQEGLDLSNSTALTN